MWIDMKLSTLDNVTFCTVYLKADYNMPLCDGIKMIFIIKAILRDDTEYMKVNEITNEQISLANEIIQRYNIVL